MSFGFGMGFTRNDPFAGGPSLNLQFAGNTVLDPSITFTRALNTATYFNSAGVLTTANANVPRFDYDPSTLAPRGLLIEEARTNLLLNSATLSTQSVTVSATAYTLSFYGTGTVTLSGTSTAGPLVGSGAFPTRSTLTFTPTAGTLTLTVTGTVQYAQLEAGGFATSVIPTTTTALTRNADSAVMTGTNFSSWYNGTNGTIFLEYGPSPTLTVDRRWLSINDTTTANRFVLNKTANLTTDGAFAVAGGVGQTIATSSVNTSSASVIRLAFSYEAAGTSMSSQGNTAATAGAITLPTVTQMNIGTDRGANPANSWIRRITYYPRRLSNAELQAITS